MFPKKVILVLAILLFVVSIQLSCSGKGASVGAVVATGATLLAVQKIREEKSSNQGHYNQGDCCMECGQCTFPCGNTCVPNGTLCTRPKGCACAIDETIPEGTPKPEPSPINCNPNTHQIAL